MSFTKEIEIPKDVIFPTGDPYSNEPPLETELHLKQMILLIECLNWLWQNRNDFYAIGNLTIYYSPNQRKTEDFRGPDFFVVLGTERKTRNSWVVWQEDGKYPNLIVELLSKTTTKVDKELKKQLYQDFFRTQNYFWFAPDTLEFAGFILQQGKYQPIEPNKQGWLWSEQLELFLGVYQRQLRFFTPDGQLVPTPQEVAVMEKQRAEREAQRAEKEAQRAERLAARLRELDIDPDALQN